MDSYSGPVITRYEIEPDVGVRGIGYKPEKTLPVRSALPLSLSKTIPGKTCMGLELPEPETPNDTPERNFQFARVCRIKSS